MQHKTRQVEDAVIFSARHLTSEDIASLEDAVNTMDLEEMVATVDQIVSKHLVRLKQCAKVVVFVR